MIYINWWSVSYISIVSKCYHATMVQCKQSSEMILRYWYLGTAISASAAAA